MNFSAAESNFIYSSRINGLAETHSVNQNSEGPEKNLDQKQWGCLLSASGGVAWEGNSR